MDPAGLMQIHLRQNNDELLDYLKGLDSWEEEMKEKDEKLTKNKSILKESLPPVRNATSQSTKQQKPKKKKKKKEVVKSSSDSKKSSRIHSNDYKAWDQFDVDKACEEVDYVVQSSSESEAESEAGVGGVEGEGESGGEENSEEGEMERQRMMAVAEKEKGNVLYKQGKYEEAVECYSRGILLDPLSAALPANRALALLKLERYAAVEEDCDTALALEEGYVKAYLRRGVARRHLGKYSEAIGDFEQVLKLEPTNKQGAAELKIAQKLNEDEKRKRMISEGHVYPVKRAAHMRSKKLLTRVLVEDISGQIETSTASETKSEDTPPVSVEAVEHSAHEPHVCTASLQSNEGVLMQSAVQEVNTSSVRDSQELGRDCAVSVAPVCAPDDAGDCDRVENSRAVMDSEAGFELPPLPQTSFELQSHWKQLRDSRPQLIAYFKRLAPTNYPALLQQSLETDVLPDIISILKEECENRQNVSSCIDKLTWLTKVTRFSVAVMFLSKKDKNNLQSMFVELLNASSSESDTSAMRTLASKFSVTL